MALGPSCETFDGWVSSDSKNNLSPASKAKGTRLYVSVSGGRASSYSPLWDVEMLRGVTGGDGATPGWEAPVERVEVNKKQMSSIMIIPL